MDKKDKKIGSKLFLIGILLLFLGMGIMLYIVFVDIEKYIIGIVSFIAGFVVGFPMLLVGTALKTKSKNADLKAKELEMLRETKEEEKVVLEDIKVEEAIKHEKIEYEEEAKDPLSSIKAIISSLTFIDGVILTTLLFSKGFKQWMLILLLLFFIGVEIIVTDLVRFKVSQNAINKWNNIGYKFAEQNKTSYTPLTLENANKGLKGKFYFWLSKDKSSKVKGILSILMLVNIGIILLASIFSGFGAVLNPEGTYIYDYSNMSGHGENSYTKLELYEDGTFKETIYSAGNLDCYGTGIWHKSSSSVYTTPTKEFNKEGELTRELDPDDWLATTRYGANYEIRI